jgi:hypothetical protein
VDWTTAALIAFGIALAVLWVAESRLTRPFRKAPKTGTMTPGDRGSAERLLATWRLRAAMNLLIAGLILVVALVGGAWPLGLLCLLPLSTGVMRLVLARRVRKQLASQT